LGNCIHCLILHGSEYGRRIEILDAESLAGPAAYAVEAAGADEFRIIGNPGADGEFRLMLDRSRTIVLRGIASPAFIAVNGLGIAVKERLSDNETKGSCDGKHRQTIEIFRRSAVLEIREELVSADAGQGRRLIVIHALEALVIPLRFVIRVGHIRSKYAIES
jgi:hypothetical protein